VLVFAPRAATQGGEREALRQEIISLCQQERYDDALVIATKALEFAEREFGPDDHKVVSSLST
jgi:hypothetical protein